jgi:hypothetical protein
MKLSNTTGNEDQTIKQAREDPTDSNLCGELIGIIERLDSRLDVVLQKLEDMKSERDDYRYKCNKADIL